MLHSTESTENNNQSQDILQSSVDQCLLIKNKLLNTASGNDHHIHNIYTNVQTIPDLNESGPLKEITLQSSELDHKQDQPSGQTNDHSDPVDGNLIENPNFKPEGGDVITNMILMTETKTDTDCCKPAVHYDLHKNPMTDDQLQNHTTDTSMNEGEVVDSVRNHEIMIHSDYKENGVSNIQTSLTNDKKIQCFSEAIDMETNCDEKMPAVERLVSDHGENDLQDTRTLLMDDEKEAIDIETKIDEKTLESSSIQTSLMDGEIIETTDMETSVSDHSENGNDLNNAQTSLIDDEQVLVPPLLETDIVENNSIVNCTEQVENFVDNIIEAPESTLSIDGTNTEEEMKNDSRCIIRENTKHGHSNTKDVEIDMGNPQDSADHMIVDTIPALETQLSEEQTVQETVDSVPELDVEKLDRIAADYIIDFQKLSSKEVVSSASKNQKPSRRQSTHQTRSENLRSSSRRKSFHDQKANDKESKESKRPKRRHTLAHTNALKAEPIEPTSEELEQSKSSSVYKPGKWAWTIDKYKTYEERFLLEIEATPDDGKTMTRSRRNQLKNNTKSESPKKIEKRVKKAVKKGKKEILSGDDQFLDIEGDEYGNDSGEVIMSQSQEIHINDIVSEEQTEKENSTPTVEDDQSEKETVEISEDVYIASKRMLTDYKIRLILQRQQWLNMNCENLTF
ncbi:hypothetical protein BC833DRAFT_360965 [Globomyces pollinis-pini]|nr:hypothetical protein BC833DRAFT_360965 [Globomyces pollinis-pini]